MSTDSWGTPDFILEAVRDCFGEIDLDPASSVEANKRVQAKAFYTKEMDGLCRPWFGKVFCNPPYSQTGKWVSKAVDEYERSCFDTLELDIILLLPAPRNDRWQRILEYSVTCFPKKRMAFIDPLTGEPVKGNKGANIICYIGGDVIFADVFEEIGPILTPY